MTSSLLKINDTTRSQLWRPVNYNTSGYYTDDVRSPVMTLRAVQLGVNVYLVGSLGVFGIFGNLLSAVVLGRDGSMRKTTRFLLQMLAVADGLFLVTCLFYQTLKTISDATTWLPEVIHRNWPIIEWVVWPCASWAQTCTVWLVVVVTADRFIAICCPLHALHYSTIRRARVAVLVVWIGSLLYNVPRLFERDLITTIDPHTNQSRTVLVRSSMRQNALYVLIYKTCLYLIVRFLVPFTALAFFNTCLIRAINASNHLPVKTDRHNGGSAGSNSNGGTHGSRTHTRMLIVVVIVFVSCALPDLFLRLWMSLALYVPAVEPALQRAAQNGTNVASNLLLTVNSCVNFVIYCFLGRKFRSILVDTLCRRPCQRRRKGGGIRNSNAPLRNVTGSEERCRKRTPLISPKCGKPLNGFRRCQGQGQSSSAVDDSIILVEQLCGGGSVSPTAGGLENDVAVEKDRSDGGVGEDRNDVDRKDGVRESGGRSISDASSLATKIISDYGDDTTWESCSASL